MWKGKADGPHPLVTQLWGNNPLHGNKESLIVTGANTAVSGNVVLQKKGFCLCV